MAKAKLAKVKQGTAPTSAPTSHEESADGRIDMEGVEPSTNTQSQDEQTFDVGNASKGVIVVYDEPTITFRSGRETLTAGGRKQRVYSLESHGKDYKKLADQFIATCKLQDGERRPRFVEAREF